MNDMADPGRLAVIAAATGQNEALLSYLLRAARTSDPLLEALVEGLVPRLLDLNSVILSASTDEREAIDSLTARLGGNWLSDPQS
ncbi:hypothetical protein [uncultured Pseudacidovorax sp.]|uniref:hypothetical protein n=1 Tax=uncultured Pseudacidovorax sp. TaxID=679313 RepID=UPI0025D60FFE|nr:hypothetical protein [uncultured Pseudacidovorax sp.]